MAVDWLVTQQGTMSTATLKEIFILTHAVKAQAGPTAAGCASAVNAAWKSAWAAVISYKANVYTGTIFTESTAAPILGLTNGDLGQAAHVAFSPTLPGTGSSSLPSQCAVAVSLSGGARANGTPYRGRFYLPAPSVNALIGDGTYAQAANTLSFIQSYAANLAAAGLTLSIWSRKDGTLVAVNQIRVGNKVDTMRSRRNELPETYSVAALTRTVNEEEVAVRDFDEAEVGHWAAN